jgi:hypothetical protein
VNTAGLVIKLFLPLLFTFAGLVAFATSGVIWPLIRIILKRGEIKKMQNIK